MTKVFIDGSSGTTGLHIRERLADRTDLTILEIPYEQRHEEDVRKQYLNDADIAFLCLPDDAAEVSARLVDNDHTVVIDTSTRHRTEDGWVYGLPELEGQREKIRQAKRIANPGCHATGFISLIAPLVKEGLIDPKSIIVDAKSGTTGAGRGAKVANLFCEVNENIKAYGVTTHRHTPEIEEVNNHIANQPGPVEPASLPEPADDNASEGGGGGMADLRQLDPYFNEAAHAIVLSQQGSTSMIQRRFSIGYNRAGRLMDQLEQAGIVGAAMGSKPRDVLVQDENSLNEILARLNGN